MRGNTRMPNGKRGSVTRVTEGGTETEVAPTSETYVPDSYDGKGPWASVGMSVSTGASAAYGRRKFEVAAWCTLPCAPDDVSIEEAYEKCYDYVTSEIDNRLDGVMKAAESIELGGGYD